MDRGQHLWDEDNGFHHYSMQVPHKDLTNLAIGYHVSHTHFVRRKMEAKSESKICVSARNKTQVSRGQGLGAIHKTILTL